MNLGAQNTLTDTLWIRDFCLLLVLVLKLLLKITVWAEGTESFLILTRPETAFIS